jgi:cytochrome c oxidase assembly factor CtaG
MNTAQFLTTAWIWNPVALDCTALALLVYARLFGWTRRAWWLTGAAMVFLLTLCSPVAALAGGYLFSAHMVQHIVLVLAVPALGLMALPPGLRLPERWMRLLNPALCWGCGIAAMWVWHLPALCDAAVASRAVSVVQTVSLLGLGGAFWWQLLAPCESQRISPLAAIGYLFTACTACTVLGILLTFSPVTVCRAYGHPVDRLGILPMIYGTWGMTPLRDQQVGGLIMWVPMCLVYLCAIFGQLARWYSVPAHSAPAHS